jgi:hypothetical protein
MKGYQILNWLCLIRINVKYFNNSIFHFNVFKVFLTFVFFLLTTVLSVLRFKFSSYHPPFVSSSFSSYYSTVCIICFVLSYCVSLRFEFRAVMSVTNSAWKLCSVRLYPLFLGGLMSFLRYFCCLRIVVSSAYCVVFLFCLSSFTLPVSLVVHFDCPFIIL